MVLCMGEIKPYTHTLDARKNFHQLFKFISRQCLLNALNTWENKKFLVSQYSIVFYLKNVWQNQKVCVTSASNRSIKGSHVLFFVFLRTYNNARFVSNKWYGTNHFTTKIIIIFIYYLLLILIFDWRMNFSLPMPHRYGRWML